MGAKGEEQGDKHMDKRPDTKGMVSRSFRETRIALRIISAESEEIRTAEVTIIDTKGDPVKEARSRVRLKPGEMILRAEIKTDRRIVGVMSPEEFLHYCRILEYKHITKGESEK